MAMHGAEMTETLHTCDVAIVGAGPVGLFAVFEFGMLGMTAQVIDTLEVSGGQCTALYPEKPIYDIPGFPTIAAAELVERLRAQAAPFKPGYHLGQQAVALRRGKDGKRWRLETSTGAAIDARVVVIAAGAGAFGPNRPPLPGIETFEGTSVHYMVLRRQDFAGKRVVVAGGGDSAVDWALTLSDVASRVSVVHRRAKFRAAPDSVNRLQALAKEERIDLVIPYQLAGLEGANGQIEAVIVADLDGGTRRIEADALLPFYGLSTSLGPIAKWGLNLDHYHIGVDPQTCRTNIEGVFAIGDIATYPGKLKLILTGFAEAAVAAHAAYPLVFEGRELHFEYSTTRGIPQG
jgi:thioredoxin reductase (NADPH)